MVDTDLREYLLDFLPENTPVQQDKVYQGTDSPRVWYQRSAFEGEYLLGGQPFGGTTFFDLEVHSLDISEAQSLADDLRSALDGYYGTFGGGSVLAVYVDDHSDEYQAKGLDSDEGFHVCALQLRVIT